MKKIYTTWDRAKPDWVAEQEAAGRTIIHNAPRPLYGHAVENSWRLPFITGRHYAAIDPAGDYAEEYTRKNEEQDARQIIYLSEAEAVERAIAWYAANLPRLWARFQENGGITRDNQKELIRSYLRQINKEEEAH